MDNQVRIFRKNPIAWWDKNVMRYLRNKYGRDKKTFLLIRSVYLALCEIESDFNNKPVHFFYQNRGHIRRIIQRGGWKIYYPHSTSSNHKKRPFQAGQSHYDLFSHSNTENHPKMVYCAKYEQKASPYPPLFL
jgi:hypothetical protein